MPSLYIYICINIMSSVPLGKKSWLALWLSTGLQRSAIPSGPRLSLSVLDSNAEFAGGGRHAPIERDEGRIEAPGNREMQRVRRSEPEIEAPDKNVGDPSIGYRDVDR